MYIFVENLNNKIVRKYFAFIRKALSGEEVDYTKATIRSAVLLLAIPMMLEMAMESVFALVDLYFVGHLKKAVMRFSLLV
jgi:Na+-driven multidrug efflux pump